jgi:hypothetical protein
MQTAGVGARRAGVRPAGVDDGRLATFAGKKESRREASDACADDQCLNRGDAKRFARLGRRRL